MASEPFEPLAGIVTPAELALQHQAETNARYLRAQSIGGQAGGFASLGVLFGQAIEAASGGKSPEDIKAAENEKILRTANAAGAEEQDPFLRQAVVLKTASDQFRAGGDFQTSAKLDTALLQLKAKQLELNKLSAEGIKAGAEADKAVIEAPFAKENILSTINERNTSIADKLSQITDRDSKPINFYKEGAIGPDGKPVMLTTSARAGDSASIIGLVGQGYKTFTANLSPTNLSGLAGDTTKATETDLQKKFLATQQNLDQFGQISRMFDPSYLTAAGKVTNWGRKILDQVGVLPAAEANKLRAYVAFRRDTQAMINDYIHEITGATVGTTSRFLTPSEEERLKSAIPDSAGDGTATFIAKAREKVREIIQIQRRTQDALANGLPLNPQTIPHIKMPLVSDEEVDAFLGPAFSAQAAAAEAGLSDDEVLKKALSGGYTPRKQ